MSLPSPLSGYSLARVAFAGVILPVAFALANQRLAERAVAANDLPASVQACGVLLGEAAVLGVLCAKWIESRPWQWTAYIWTWLLLDLTVIPVVARGSSPQHPPGMLMPAILSAQLGPVVVWAVFGRARWSIRWPVAAAMLLLGVCLPLIVNSRTAHPLSAILAGQTMTLLVICVFLRWGGYRLIDVDDPQFRAVAAARQRQFGIGDVLLWMTLLATLLGIARAYDLVSSIGILLSFRERSALLLAGISTAFAMAAALCAMLGEGNVWARWMLFFGTCLGSAIALPVLSSYRWFAAFLSSQPLMPFLNANYWDYFITTKWPLLMWIGLASAMFIAALVFHRTLGIRLRRASR